MKKIFTLLIAMLLCSTITKAEAIYSADFMSEEEFQKWTVVDANADGTTWGFDSDAEPSHTFYSYNSFNSGDDWLISPSITVDKDGTYALTVKVKGSSYGEKLEVFAGTSTKPEDMTTKISDIEYLTDETISLIYIIQLTTDTPFYIGFHAISDADKWRLYLCDMSLKYTENPIDLQVTDIISPVSDFDLSHENISIKVKNNGFNTIESFDVSYSIDGGEVVTETVNQTLEMDNTLEYTFATKVDLSTPRHNYTIKAWSSHPNEINVSNDSTTVNVLHKAPATLPYFMGFEENENTSGITFWNLNNDNGDWELYSDPWWNLARTGDYCLAYNYDNNNNAEDWAILEPITIPEAGYYVLKFWYSGDDSHPEKLAVYYGNNATPEAMTNKIVEYAPFARSAYEESINIIYIDQPQTINIGFYAFSNKDENWLCVDDVSLEKIDSEAIDLMALPITNPLDYVHNGTKKDINFAVRNLGIKDATATIRATLSDNVIYEENVTLLAQEIKEFSINNALKDLTSGQHSIKVEIISAEDTDTNNNTTSHTFRVMGTPTAAWDFEDGIVPSEFTLRVEDEGTINPSAGAEFNKEGWGIFSIQNHELFGEHVLAGTSWIDGTEQADRWCILPPFKPSEESFLIWDAQSFNPHYLEDYAIMISSNGDDSWYYFTQQEITSESSNFKTRGIDLSEHAGKSIYIAFRLKSKNCEHLILDNIELYGGSIVEPLEVKATAYPAEGIVEKLDNFTIEFENVESVALEDYSFYPPYIASIAEDGTMTQIASAKSSIIEGEPTKINVSITQEGLTQITEDGKYALVIPRKDLIFNDDKTIITTNNEFVFHYQIGEEVVPNGALPTSISPADGSIVKSIHVVLLQFSPEDYPNTMNYDYTKSPKLYNEAGELVAEGHYGYGDNTFYCISISFDKPITDKGVYSLKIGQGDILEYSFGINNPKICPAIDITYTVGDAEPQYSISVTPAPGNDIAIEDIKEFAVTFHGVSKIDFSNEAWHGYLLRIDDKGNTLEEFPATCTMVSNETYCINLQTEPTEFGTYRLVIPQAAVMICDQNGVSGYNKEFTADYSVTYSSVESIVSEDSEFNVYDINGVCVFRNAKKEDLKLLHNGIYVINGKKVLIK